MARQWAGFENELGLSRREIARLHGLLEGAAAALRSAGAEPSGMEAGTRDQGRLTRPVLREEGTETSPLSVPLRRPAMPVASHGLPCLATHVVAKLADLPQGTVSAFWARCSVPGLHHPTKYCHNGGQGRQLTAAHRPGARKARSGRLHRG